MTLDKFYERLASSPQKFKVDRFHMIRTVSTGQCPIQAVAFGMTGKVVDTGKAIAAVGISWSDAGPIMCAADRVSNERDDLATQKEIDATRARLLKVLKLEEHP